SLCAVSEKSFGGKIMALRLLQKNGISPEDYLEEIYHTGNHNTVVHEVLRGKANIGTVRTGILEEMADSGEIDLNEIKVISPVPPTPYFPFLRSTILYPEWVFSKLSHTDQVLANKIAMLLFETPYNSTVSKEIGIWGWTYPSSYGIIHHTLANLNIDPYPMKQPTLIQIIIKEHLTEALALLAFIILVVFLSINLYKIQSREKMEAIILQRVKEKLDSSQANLKSLIESTDDAIVSFDKEGKLIICNAKFREIVKKSTGIDLKAGVKLLEITPSKQRKFWEDVYQRALKGEKFSRILSYHQESSNPRYYHITFNPIIKNNEILGFTEFSRDISQIKQKEIELRKMHEAVEQSASSIIITDKDGKIEYVNPRFCEIAGYTKEEVLGKNPSILKSGYHSEDFYKNLWETIISGKIWKGELKNKKKNGNYYWKVSTIAPIKNDKGIITNFIAINEDITSRKESEVELQKANKKLRQLSEHLEEKVEKAVAEVQKKDYMLIAQSKQAAMGEMIANIAHQWRQPLSAVAAIVQDIEDAFEFGELNKEYLANSVKKTMQQIEFMSQTIDDFRNFFSPNKTQVPFIVKEKIEKTLAFLESSIKQYQIDVQMDIKDDCKCTGYPNEFSQVILNILTNAKDAIKEAQPDFPFIRIECDNANNEHRKIIISNNGGQIPEDKIDKIFQPYFTTKEKGTGLGLYMSKMIVESKLKGKLSLKNIKNGVQFIIEI
ncbi:MAG: PAS domain S-box protein, partial [Candidatus Cloacimonadota bacterium]|nr:PAS domain S-box protein [Candidatus Cloacimonadota bacterium]